MKVEAEGYLELDPRLITRKSKSSFLPAFLFLGRKKREGLAVIYAFCRILDDAVDEGNTRDLRPFRKEVEEVFKGTPGTPLGLALLEVKRDFGISREDLEEVISGCEMDMAKKRYETFEELENYCMKVASAVGRMALSIFGIKGKEAVEYANATGIALQLTNIIRDMGEDYSKGRVYIPLEDLRRFAVKAEMLDPARKRTQEENGRLEELIRFQARRAGSFFSRSDELLEGLNRRDLVPAEAMKLIYRKLLARLERAGPVLISRKVTLPGYLKLLLAFKAWIHGFPVFQ